MESYDPFYRYLLPFLTQVPMAVVLLGGMVAIFVRWAQLGKAAIPALIGVIMLILLRISAAFLQTFITAASNKGDVDLKLIFGLNSILTNVVGAVSLGLLLYAIFLAAKTSAS